jgi:hypothetical protein
MLAGTSFYVRLHWRGFKGRLSTPKEQRFLDEALLDAWDALGRPGRISFADPDALLQIETIDGRAGVSLRRREDLRRDPFLGSRDGARRGLRRVGDSSALSGRNRRAAPVCRHRFPKLSQTQPFQAVRRCAGSEVGRTQ